jgi:hypothetical protein
MVNNVEKKISIVFQGMFSQFIVKKYCNVKIPNKMLSDIINYMRYLHLCAPGCNLPITWDDMKSITIILINHKYVNPEDEEKIIKLLFVAKPLEDKKILEVKKIISQNQFNILYQSNLLLQKSVYAIRQYSIRNKIYLSNNQIFHIANSVMIRTKYLLKEEEYNNIVLQYSMIEMLTCKIMKNIQIKKLFVSP